MNRKNSPSRKIQPLARSIAICLGLAVATSANAQLTWDVAGPTDNWSTAGGDTNWLPGNVVWTNGESAIFGATPETVSVTTAVTVDDITFNNSWTISNGAGSINLTTDGNTNITVGTGFNTTIAETLGGTNAVTKLGLGTLSLIGAGLPDTFSGGLAISAGTVAFTLNTALGGTGGTAGAISLNGGTLQAVMAAASITNTHIITVGASGGAINITKPTSGTFTYIMGNAGNLAGSGDLTVSGTGSLIHGVGASTLVLGNANAGYTGTMTIQDGGIVEYANAGGVASSTIIVGNNGELSANSVTVAKNITLNSGSSLAFQNANTGVFSGPIALNGDASIRMRDWYNTATRSGTISSTITGAHTLNVNSGTDASTGGTLTLGGFDAKASSADIILNGASLSLNSNSGTAAASVTRANSLTINGGNLTVTGVASQNTNDVFGTLNLGGGSASTTEAGILQGYSTWTLTPNAATGAALIFTNMGTRTAGSWVALTGTFASATPGAAAAGNIFFTNAPSGSNLIGNGGALASGTASVIPWLRDTSGTNIFGYDPTVGVALITSVNIANLNTATSGQNVALTGSIALTASKTINSLKAAFQNVDMGGNTLTVASGVITADNMSFNNGTLDFGAAEGQISVHNARGANFNAPISGSGGLTYVGFKSTVDPSLVLAGANTYTGVTNFYGYGGNTNVRLTNSLALQNTTLNHVAGRAYTMTFGNGGTTGQTAYTFGGLSGNANLNLNNNNTTVGAVALTIGSAGSADTASTVNTYSGVLSNTVAGGSIIKDGVAIEVLSGANTYSGGTTITKGDLRLGNTSGSATGSGQVLVSGGISATLSGTGIATGLTTVTSGSRLAPGNNTSGNFGAGGTLSAGTTGGLTLTDAHLDFDLQTTAASAMDDLINTAALSLGSSIAFTFNGLGGSLETGTAYTLIDAGSITGFDKNNISTTFLGPLNGFYSADYSVNGNDLQVTFASVPEPGSAISLLGGLGVLLGLQRFRRRVGISA